MVTIVIVPHGQRIIDQNKLNSNYWTTARLSMDYYVPVQIGRGLTLTRRRTIRLSHFSISAIHKTMGKFVATQIRDSSNDLELWERALFVVLISRFRA